MYEDVHDFLNGEYGSSAYKKQKYLLELSFMLILKEMLLK